MEQFSSVFAIVKEAGSLLLDQTLSKDIRAKAPADYVTQADVTVQRCLQEKLGQLYPEVGFLGEEQAEFEWDFDKPLWILDPVDGTTNLIHDFNHSAISLALVEHGKPVMGVVYNPFTNQMYTAVEGQSAFLNGSPIHVSQNKRLADSLISIGTSPGNRSNPTAVFTRMQRFFEHCQDVRRNGAASLDLCYVACGKLDGYFEENLKPWDYAAGMLLVQEAGGKITDRHGDPLVFRPEREISATNGWISDEFLQLV